MNSLSRFLALYLVSLCVVPWSQADEGLVLWNTMGSNAEVANSRVGQNGTVVGTQHVYEPAQHGAGYVRQAVGLNYLRFPHAVVADLKTRGSLELWVNPKVPAPVPFVSGVFGLVGTPYRQFGVPRCCNVNLLWGDGVTGQGLYGEINFGGTSQAVTSQEPTQFQATVGVPFHAAISWDIDGIDGSADTLRVYRDGVVVNSTTDRWDPSGTEEYPLILGYNPDSGGFDQFIVDNLIVWDYARTDFSGRFVADPRVGAPRYVDQTSLVDMNGNGSPELVALRAFADGRAEFVVKDSATSEFISKFEVGPADGLPTAISGLLDLNGNGYPEVAVLFTKDNGQGLVKIKDAQTNQWLNTLSFFWPAWTVTGITAQDLNFDGVSEISVLGVKDDGTKVATQIKDSMTKEQLNWMSLPID